MLLIFWRVRVITVAVFAANSAVRALYDKLALFGFSSLATV